jgi:hypothetical protein
VRLAHAENNDEATLKSFADGQVASDAHVVTDGLASHNKRGLNERAYDMIVQTKAERRENDALQAYLDEFAFRYNRRKSVGRSAARVIEQLVLRKPLMLRELIDDTKPCRWFASAQAT